MIANLFGFGKRGKIWAKHLIQNNYSLNIYDPRYPEFSKELQIRPNDVNIITSSSNNHINNIKYIYEKFGNNQNTIWVEKPLVTTLEDLEYIIKNNIYVRPLYCERFKYAVQFIKSLNLKPTSVQSVMSVDKCSCDFFTDKLIHHLDLVEFLWNIQSKPKYTSDYCLSHGMESFFTYCRSFEYSKISWIIIHTEHSSYKLDLYNNSLTINGELIDFGPQDTISCFFKSELFPSVDYLEENLFNGPTKRAIEMTYEY